MKKILILVLASIAMFISFFFDKQILTYLGVAEVHISQPLVSSLFILLLLVIITLYFLFKDQRAILPLWDSVFFGWAISVIIKFLIMRPRMFVTKLYPFGFNNYSFPSSHTAIVFAALPLLFSKNRKLAYAWLCYAVIVAYSRIFLKMHYLSDVIAGAIVGCLAGYFTLLIYKKYNKKFRKSFRWLKDYF